ncbi:LIM homeobox transcription factor 1-alpha-like [Clavelina lepadiformis]|uniref:LIM homeobox transcription factor 1-alpha-like n=1 Tax=Clavelina lepadiformis TaxID=159417 RepID=UPI004042B264
MHFPPTTTDLRYSENSSERECFDSEKFHDVKMSSNMKSSSLWPDCDPLGEVGALDEICNTSLEHNSSTDVTKRHDDLAKLTLIPEEDLKKENSPVEYAAWTTQASTAMAENFTTTPKANAFEQDCTSEHFQQLCGNFCSEKTAESEISDVLRRTCQACHKPIVDKYILEVSGLLWHEACAECATCRIKLPTSCFVANGKLYCKTHYQNVCKRCAGCGLQISSKEFIIRIKGTLYVYHMSCLSCVTCKKLLQPAMEYHVYDQNSMLEPHKRLQCDVCWENHSNQHESTASYLPISNESTPATMMSTSPGVSSDLVESVLSPKSSTCPMTPKSDDDDILSSDNESTSGHLNSSKYDGGEGRKNSRDDDDSLKDNKKSKRPRTILNANQRRTFKTAFDLTPKPCRKVRETLAKDTGLTARVVQVWFQNQRAKVKKLAKRQQSQEAAAMKAREDFGIHGFDPLTPMSHQIQTILPGTDILIDPMYSQFHPHHHAPFQGQLLRPHVPWEANHREIPMYPTPFPNSTNQYQEIAGPPPNVTMATAMHDVSNQQVLPNMVDHDNGYHGNIRVQEIFSKINHGDVHHTSPGPVQGCLQHCGADAANPIDHLFSMQNNYFTS